jgi:UDP-GlcNAc:undecaprenyl-phosphate GlcNAc-1-phosphate transferase
MSLIIIVSFLFALIFCLLIIRSQYLNSIFSDNIPGPQKFHIHSPPRLGGLAIYLSLFSTIFLGYLLFSNSIEYSFIFYILLLSIPCFFAALHDDLFKNTNIWIRLICTSVSAFMICYYFDIWIVKTGFTNFDILMQNKYLCIIITIFAITGLSNAYNIIDGFNGLASMVGVLSLASLAYGYYVFNDIIYVKICFMFIAAILGFFVINYPRGIIFLGDCGAYLIGLIISILSVNLAYSHQSISPLFIILVNIYPITETIFSIIRRSVINKVNPTLADSNHLHTLIFKRFLIKKNTKNNLTLITLNAKTSPFLWLLSIFGMIPAILFIDNQNHMKIASIIFILIYLLIYYYVLGKDLPNWLK